MDDAAIEKFPDECEARPAVALYETSVVDIFYEVVANDIPTHLIYIPEKRVVSSAALAGIFRPEDITEAEITEIMERNRYTRSRAITAIVCSLLKYAILSHRWLREGEPTYIDVMNGATWEGPGYDKLLRFCEKAQEYGCVLAWADTCCIDKSSSTELDEAIRSMFRWYREAYICVVYLAGVLKLEDIHRDDWFRRGWTLQELLAPRTTKFYGSNWEALGEVERNNDKEDDKVLGAISQTTSIPIQDLRGFVPGCTRVQEKMVWASKRRTIRVEDTAYALIGMFDISMQASYGEGDWAFHRLMEIILQRCDEWEVFAWAGPSSGHSSSRTIPKSPRCYYTIDFSNFCDRRQGSSAQLNVSGGKRFSMTPRGLEMKLPIMKGKMTLQLDGTFSFHATPKLPGMAHPFTPIEGRTSWRGRPGDCAIGIVNYRDTAGEGKEKGLGMLVPHKEYLCFLLCAYAGIWRRVSTSNVLITQAMFPHSALSVVDTVCI